MWLNTGFENWGSWWVTVMEQEMFSLWESPEHTLVFFRIGSTPALVLSEVLCILICLLLHFVNHSLVCLLIKWILSAPLIWFHNRKSIANDNFQTGETKNLINKMNDKQYHSQNKWQTTSWPNEWQTTWPKWMTKTSWSRWSTNNIMADMNEKPHPGQNEWQTTSWPKWMTITSWPKWLTNNSMADMDEKQHNGQNDWQTTL